MRRGRFEDIQAWYAELCNGDWEHGYGVHVETMDNPGWSLRINLSETPWREATFEEFDENPDPGLDPDLPYYGQKGPFLKAFIEEVDGRRVWTGWCDRYSFDRLVGLFLDFAETAPLVGRYDDEPAPTHPWRAPTP